MTRGRVEAVKLIVCEVNSTCRPVLPRPLVPSILSSSLAEPQFEPQRVHSVQVVSEQPFVSDKTQVLVQLQGRFVGDFSLQYNLGTQQVATSVQCCMHGWFTQGLVLTQNLVQKGFLDGL